MFKRKIKIFLLMVVFYLSVTNLMADVIVPNVVELTFDEAKTVLQQQGLRVGNISEKVTSEPKGTILRQSPRANSQVSNDTEVRLIVAVAAKTFNKTQVPNVQGLSLKAAIQAIQAANLRVGSIKKIRKPVETEIVLYQTPLVDTPRIENTLVDLIVAEPTPLLIAGVKLNFDKKELKIGESLKLNAKALNLATNKPLRYSFTINRKVFYSKKPEFSYKFTVPGTYNVLASVRYGKEPWIASTTHAIQVANNTLTAQNSVSDKTPQKKEIVEKDSPSPTAEKKLVKQENIASKTQEIQQKITIVKHEKEAPKKEETKQKIDNTAKVEKKIAKVAKPSPQPIHITQPRLSSFEENINRIVKQAGSSLENRTDVAVLNIAIEEKDNALYQALLTKRGGYQNEGDDTLGCQLSAVYYSDDPNSEKNNNLLPLVNENIKTALLSGENSTHSDNGTQLTLQQFKQARLEATDYINASPPQLTAEDSLNTENSRPVEQAISPADKAIIPAKSVQIVKVQNDATIWPQWLIDIFK